MSRNRHRRIGKEEGEELMHFLSFVDFTFSVVLSNTDEMLKKYVKPNSKLTKKDVAHAFFLLGIGQYREWLSSQGFDFLPLEEKFLLEHKLK